MSLPRSAGTVPRGSVLGIDIGFSPTRRSSAVCRLDWAEGVVGWRIKRFRYDPEERRRAIANLAGEAELAAVAIDGPLGPGLVPVTAYRMAERLLTIRLGRLIGKPGASSAPVGRRLAQAACEAARTVLEVARVAPASHPDPVHALALVEAFPSSFLGLLLAEPEKIEARRGNRSDLYYLALCRDGMLADLVADLVPGLDRPALTARLIGVTDHDDRAALVCALTALAVAAGRAAHVGDAEGRIALPPLAMMRGWARDLLRDVPETYGGPEALIA